MNRFWFEQGLVEGRWREHIEIGVDENGLIGELSFDTPKSQDAERVPGIAIPCIANVHSHAFQRKFAGQCEYFTHENDNFWTWREEMYASLQGLDPNLAEENATRLYRLMVQHGYSSVGEFHYVHNDETGQPYPELAAMSDAHVRAALNVGIRICLMPVVYQRAGFDDSLLSPAQKRFELDDDQFFGLLDDLHSKWSDNPLVNLGMAFHSLRAVDPAKIKDMVARFDSITGGGPIHIHVSEQTKEVEDCLQWTGKRPIELLFDLADVNERWCLIHATHANQDELAMIANSGAVVGICPTTEANLGDGIFPAPEFIELGGRISVGSDSHVSVSPFSELRLLEYGQRLRLHRRAVLCTDEESCGRFLFHKALAGGAQALAQARVSGIEEGGPADWMVLEPNYLVDEIPVENLLSWLVFGEFGNHIGRMMIAGRWIESES